MWLEPAEKVHHSTFELGLESGHKARGVDLREGHAEFVGQPPETCEKDGPC